MDNSVHHHRSHLFTVRLWAEELSASQSEWRGKVEHIISGEGVYFRDWSALVAFLVTTLPQLNRDEASGSSYP